MSFEIDRYAHVASPVQQWDPRYKIASIGLLVFLIALLQTLPLALCALAIAVFAFALSRLPLELLRTGVTWLLIFMLPFFILLPMSYPSAVSVSWMGLPFSTEGLRLALLITVKALAIITLCYTAFGSARFHHSMYALQKLRCPTLLINMILFSYRYVFVLVEEMRRMYDAMLARGFQPGTNRRTLTVLGHYVGGLLLRSLERTDRVYKAMLSKGFTGEFHCLVTFEAKTADRLKAAGVNLLALLLWSTDFFGPFSHAVKAWY